MSSRAPWTEPLGEAPVRDDHLAGRLGAAVTDVAIDRGWIVATGDTWRLADDLEDRIRGELGLTIHLTDDLGDHASEGQVAGRFGAALDQAMLDAGWLTQTPDTRALTITPKGELALRRAGIQGVHVDADACDADNLCSANAVLVTAAGGEDWPALVDRAVREGWTGIAALAACPGTVADAVERNHAAYGESVGDVIWSVRTWDRHDRTHRTFAAVDGQFRPGGSRFAPDHGDRRYDVLEASFLFRTGTITAPILDAGLLALVHGLPGVRLPLAQVRDAVLAR